MLYQVNRNKIDQWKGDIARSVDYYNDWFLKFAPRAFRETRTRATEEVEDALAKTNNITNIKADMLEQYPSILPVLRMATCPPIARDRLIGLAGVSANLVNSMEKKGRVPPSMKKGKLIPELERIGEIITGLLDPDIVVWRGRDDKGTDDEVFRAAIIVADRLCGAQANPIIRNAQEKRQLLAIKTWLENRGYRELGQDQMIDFQKIPPGTFTFRLNIPGVREDGKSVNIPIDAVIKPKDAKPSDFPVFFEAKSAGDFANTNKRRKEEAIKIQQLRNMWGDAVTLNLFLCGYFDARYLGHEGAEGIDWVWEHRIDDLEEFGF